jgi:hypothetical protein
MAKVLCTGWDRSLLDTRTMILRSAGHEVRQAGSQRQVESECAEHSFDVAVIGQSVSGPMKRSAAASIRQHCPAVKILELYQPHLGISIEDADGWLAVPTDIPEDLAQHVSNLAKEPRH